MLSETLMSSCAAALAHELHFRLASPQSLATPFSRTQGQGDDRQSPRPTPHKCNGGHYSPASMRSQPHARHCSTLHVVLHARLVTSPLRCKPCNTKSVNEEWQ